MSAPSGRSQRTYEPVRAADLREGQWVRWEDRYGIHEELVEAVDVRSNAHGLVLYETSDGQPHRLTFHRDWPDTEVMAASDNASPDAFADLCGMCGESLRRPQPRCPAYKGHTTDDASGSPS